MSMSPLGGIAASAAGIPSSQNKGTEADRAHQQSATERQNATSAKAESAAGIGKTEEEQQASDRDADGRRLWEEPPAAEESADSAADTATPRTKDLTGEAGNELDLIG